MALVQAPSTISVASQKAKIIANMNQAFNQLNSSFTTIFQQIWTNPNFTAQQIFDEFGSDAAELFVISAKVQTLLNDVVPNVNQLTPPNQFTINPDKTVTVGAKI